MVSVMNRKQVSKLVTGAELAVNANVMKEIPVFIYGVWLQSEVLHLTHYFKGGKHPDIYST